MSAARAYSVVFRVRGPEWDELRPMREQDGWDAHARFMNALAQRGVVVLGGPIGAGERRFLLVCDGSEAAVRDALDDDPWAARQLEVELIEPWTILLEAP